MIIGILDFVIYWAIALIPFAMAIAPAPMNVFAGLLIFAFLLKKVIARQNPLPHTPLNLPFFLFFIASALSMVNSINYSDSFRGLFRFLEFFFILLILSSQVKDQRHAAAIVASLACGALLLSIDAIWQLAWGRDFIRGNLPIVNIGLKRATASFPDANVLGIYLSAVAPVVITLALYHFKKNKIVFVSLVSLLVLSAAALTYSRPSLLAIFVALLLLGIVKKDKALVSLLLILTVIAPFILPISVKNWAKEVGYNPLRFMCNDDRIAIYRNSLRMIGDHSVIGVGVNTFMKNYKKYKESPEYRGIVTSDYIYAHNNFFHMAAEVGMLGLGIFLWLIFRLFKEAIAIYKRLKDEFLKNISLGLILCLAAFLINGLTESSLYYSRIAMIFWYLAGFSLSLGKFTDERQSSSN